jgi:hypothetical protein
MYCRRVSTCRRATVSQHLIAESVHAAEPRSVSTSSLWWPLRAVALHRRAAVSQSPQSATASATGQSPCLQQCLQQLRPATLVQTGVADQSARPGRSVSQSPRRSVSPLWSQLWSHGSPLALRTVRPAPRGPISAPPLCRIAVATTVSQYCTSPLPSWPRQPRRAAGGDQGLLTLQRRYRGRYSWKGGGAAARGHGQSVSHPAALSHRTAVAAAVSRHPTTAQHRVARVLATGSAPGRGEYA